MKEVTQPTKFRINSNRISQLAIFLLCVAASLLVEYFYTSIGSTVKNPGIAFGIALPQYLQLLSYIFVAIYLLWKAIKTTEIYIVILFSGVILNFKDKLSYNAVIDYWQIAGIWFNINDIFICLGAAIVTYKIYDYYRRESRAEA